MSKVVVTAAITAHKSVTLSPGQPDMEGTDTFLVDDGDTLAWQLRDAADPTRTGFEGFRARIRFVGFPTGDKRQLLDGGNLLEAAPDGVVSGGRVNAQALAGQYRYAVELVRPDGTLINLDCAWARFPGAPSKPTDMAGGKKGGGP